MRTVKPRELRRPINLGRFNSCAQHRVALPHRKTYGPPSRLPTKKMRLINTCTLRLENFYHDPIEPYAILSHTWGKDGEEMSFQDIMSLDGGPIEASAKTAKLVGCCNQAKGEGFKYVWVDTCCIDKTNSVELNEAINSMFRWYQNSTVCYTYLSDIEVGQRENEILSSRWFTRGWTLQELLASKKMIFFDSSWNLLGTKSSLYGLIGKATGIPHHILIGLAGLDSASVAQKMSWASTRTTTRPEDMAYCLLGIFGVMIPLLYGEGLQASFERLQEAIMKKTQDDSILAWSLGSRDQDKETAGAGFLSAGVLATSPAVFEGCGSIVKRPQKETRIEAFDIFGGTMPMRMSLSDTELSPSGLIYGFLSCGPKDQPDKTVVIPLAKSPDHGAEAHSRPVFIRPQGFHSILLDKSRNKSPQNIQVRKDRETGGGAASDRCYWFYLPEPYPYGAVLEEVYPPEAWEKDLATIRSPKNVEDGNPALFLARFLFPSLRSSVRWDCILGLEFSQGSSTGSEPPRAFLLIDNEDTSLAYVAGMWRFLSMATTDWILLPRGEKLTVDLRVETLADLPLWVLKLRSSGEHTLRDTSGSIFPNTKGQQLASLVKCIHETLIFFDFLRHKADLERQVNKDSNGSNALLSQRDSIVTECSSIKQDIRDMEVRLQAMRNELISKEQQVEALTWELATVSSSLRLKRRKMEMTDGIIKLIKCHQDETGFQTPLNGHKGRLDASMAYLMQARPLHIDGKAITWVQGITPLMYAAGTGDEEFVSLVWQYDKGLEVTDSTGRTPLDWAHLAGSETVKKFLAFAKSLPLEKEHDAHADEDDSHQLHPQKHKGDGPSSSSQNLPGTSRSTELGPGYDERVWSPPRNALPPPLRLPPRPRSEPRQKRSWVQELKKAFE